MWTDQQIKRFAPRAKEYRLTENTKERNRGRLLLKILPDGKKDFYFQYFIASKKHLIRIGRFRSTPGEVGVTLSEARNRAREWGNLVIRGVDVQRHLDEQRRSTLEKGSFEHLLNSYVGSLKAKGRTSYISVEKSLQRYVIKPFPKFMKRAAIEIEARDIRDILAKMIDKGITTHSNRVRSYLHAAFQHGLHQDTNPRNYTQDRTFFGLRFNPVSQVPRQQDFEHVGQRVIADEEIQIIWNGIPEKSAVMGYALNLAFATGQRPGELLRITWKDIDFEKNVLLMRAEISKNRRENLVPLNAPALDILVRLKILTAASNYPFAAAKGGVYRETQHTTSTSLNKVIRLFCAERKAEKKVELAPFTPRDIRRTVKTKLAEIGINKEVRDRIQNHAMLSDVAEKHYNRYDFLREKTDALALWGDLLTKIVAQK